MYETPRKVVREHGPTRTKHNTKPLGGFDTMSRHSITVLDQDFDSALRAFLADKRKVSPLMHTFLRVLVFSSPHAPLLWRRAMRCSLAKLRLFGAS
jgi:hypothetical protein